ncbi:MAG: hypothetical protein RMI56_01230 [Sulfolobales archaeon]|nr:hypothetical protein [Sulfolobales archaeon]MDW8082402.1 hypothetical protein [Sulfolobales archaeon]
MRILYDMRTLRRRLELLEARIERSLENAKSRGIEVSIAKSYSNALKQIRYVVYALGVLEVKLENIVALNTVTQDLVVTRDVLKELSERIGSIPEISAILDEIGDDISEVMSETINIDQQAAASRREATKRILEEAEKYAEVKQQEASGSVA